MELDDRNRADDTDETYATFTLDRYEPADLKLLHEILVFLHLAGVKWALSNNLERKGYLESTDLFSIAMHLVLSGQADKLEDLREIFPNWEIPESIAETTKEVTNGDNRSNAPLQIAEFPDTDEATAILARDLGI